MVKVGDSIPSIPLVEGAPDNAVDLSKELATGNGIIIGVPAAFSMFTSALQDTQASVSSSSRELYVDIL